MPLTPEDVSNKRFTPVRLREGYDMGEVDQFLDEVEAELERLLAENDDLRTKLTAAGGTPPAPAESAKDEAAPESAEKPTEEPAEEPDGAADDAVAAEAPAAAAPREEIKVTTAAEASSAATRLLELATRNADEVVAEARQDAERIVSEARAEAERLQTETKTLADKLEEDARNRAQNLDSETSTRREELLGEMEKEKGRLDGEIESLRAFEREYRSRLRTYFSEQLAALEGDGAGGELPVSDGPAQPAHQSAPEHDEESPA